MPGIFTQQPVRAGASRANYCTNPRVVVNTTSWGTLAGTGGVCTLARVTGLSSGSYQRSTGARATWTTATTAVGGGLFVSAAPVIAGQTFTASAYVAPSIVQTLVLSIEWKNSGGTTISTTSGTVTAFTAGQVKRLSASGLAPAGTISANITIYATTGGVVWPLSSTLTATAVLMESSGTLGTYFDGATPDGNLDAYGWGNDNPSDPDSSVSYYYVAGAADQVAPVFGPTTPTEYARESNSIVRGLLEDPSQMLTTLRKAGLRSGEWSMLFDTAAAAKRAVDMLANDKLFYFDGAGDASQAVTRFITPQGQQVRMHAVENTPNSTGAEWLYEVVCPWQEVS